MLVPLSTFLRPPELRAQLATAGIEHLVLVPTFRDHDYVADLGAIAADVPRLRGVTVGADLLAAAADTPRDDGFVDALDATVRPADDKPRTFVGATGQRPGCIRRPRRGAGGDSASAAGIGVTCCRISNAQKRTVRGEAVNKMRYCRAAGLVVSFVGGGILAQSAAAGDFCRGSAGRRTRRALHNPPEPVRQGGRYDWRASSPRGWRRLNRCTARCTPGCSGTAICPGKDPSEVFLTNAQAGDYSKMKSEIAIPITKVAEPK